MVQRCGREGDAAEPPNAHNIMERGEERPLQHYVGASDLTHDLPFGVFLWAEERRLKNVLKNG